MWIERAACWIVAVMIMPVCLVVIVFVAGSVDSTMPAHMRQVAAKAQIEALVSALDSYGREIGQFPNATEGLGALRSDPGTSLDRMALTWIRAYRWTLGASPTFTASTAPYQKCSHED